MSGTFSFVDRGKQAHKHRPFFEKRVLFLANFLVIIHFGKGLKTKWKITNLQE